MVSGVATGLVGGEKRDVELMFDPLCMHASVHFFFFFLTRFLLGVQQVTPPSFIPNYR